LLHFSYHSILKCKKSTTIYLREERSVPAFGLSIQSAIQGRIKAAKEPCVWTADDFADLGSRSAIDVALHRMAASGDVRRVARGLYDMPGMNQLTGKPTTPDPSDVIGALARKGKVRILVDGITAANDLGLTDAVPARIEVLTDGRLRPIKLGNLILDFHHAAPSRLYWTGRPAMRFVQALHWLRDLLPSDDGGLRRRLVSILRDLDHGQAIRDDLRAGFSALPEWMRAIVRDLLGQAETGKPTAEHPPLGVQRRVRKVPPFPQHAPISENERNPTKR
jgi:hypothetical protein